MDFLTNLRFSLDYKQSYEMSDGRVLLLGPVKLARANGAIPDPGNWIQGVTVGFAEWQSLTGRVEYGDTLTFNTRAQVEEVYVRYDGCPEEIFWVVQAKDLRKPEIKNNNVHYLRPRIISKPDIF